MDLYNDPALQAAQGASRQAMQGYSQAVHSAATLPKMLEDALNKKFSQDNPLNQQREEAAGNYINEFTNAPASVLPENNQGMVFNPIEQANMIRGRRTGALLPLLSANSLIGWQQKGIADTVGEAGDMWETMARQAQIDAEMKRQDYKDLLELISAKADEAFRQKEFEEKIRQFNVQEGRLGKESAGMDMSGILELLLNQNEGGGGGEIDLSGAVDLAPEEIFGTRGLSYSSSPNDKVIKQAFGTNEGLSTSRQPESFWSWLNPFN